MASARERQVEDFCSRIPCAGCGHPDSPLGSHDCDAWRRQWKRIHFALPPEAEAKETKQFFDALQTAAQTAAASLRIIMDDEIKEHAGHLQRINGPSSSAILRRGDRVTVTQVITGS